MLWSEGDRGDRQTGSPEAADLLGTPAPVLCEDSTKMTAILTIFRNAHNPSGILDMDFWSQSAV
jgi:hypothetical protein